MEARSGLIIADCYELQYELARGGMGAVWAAHSKKLDEQVAIKFMGRELAENPDARTRFEREAKAAAKLRSPHVVQILDYGVDGDLPYIVMERLEGQDLKTRLKQRFRLTLPEASEILTQACKALRLAADAGIVHRDLKPGNIFLARSGDDEMVKILDFGVAKAVRKTIGPNTSSGMLLGSPHYMSPEQARAGATLDHRGDLWSIAVILFQMITGKKPFVGEELGDVIVKICTEPTPRVCALVPELPATLDHFFDRALAKDPNARFQSARSLASEFAAIARQHGGAAIPASPISNSGEHPAVSSGSFPGDSGKGLESSYPSGSDSVRILEATPWPPSAPRSAPPDTTPDPNSAGSATLMTVATRSLPMPRAKNRKLVLVASVLVVLGVVAFVLLRSPSVENPAAVSPAAPPSTATPEAPPPAEDAPEPPAASVSAEVQPSANVLPSAGPADSAKPPTGANGRPSSVATPRPPSPHPTQPKVDPDHPVLGF